MLGSNDMSSNGYHIHMFMSADVNMIPGLPPHLLEPFREPTIVVGMEVGEEPGATGKCAGGGYKVVNHQLGAGDCVPHREVTWKWTRCCTGLALGLAGGGWA